MDRRFPTLRRLSECRDLGRRVLDPVREVERRTGTSAIVNTAGDGRVIFRYGDNIAGPFGASVPQIRGWTGGDVDAVVSLIQSAKRPRDEKDAIAKDNELRERSDRQSFQDRVIGDATPDAVDYVAHKDRARRGVAKVISA